MKTLKFILSLWSVFLGAVVGAGFLSGSELVVFLGGNDFKFIILSGVLFIVALIPLYGLSCKYNDLPLAVEKSTGCKKAYKVSVTVSAFIFFTAMIAGLDALGQTFGLNFPLFSLSAILVVLSLARYGIGGLEKLNAILMPIVIVLVNVVILRGNFSFAPSTSTSNVGNVFLYVTMNVFVSAPALFSAAQGKSKKVLIISAILSAVTLCVEAYLITSKIYSVKGAKNAHLPLLVATDGKGKYVLFTALLLGTLTSLACAFHPVYEYTKNSCKGFGAVIACAFSFALSRIGLSAVVKYLYPLIGGVGAAFIIGLGIGFIREFIYERKRKGGRKFARQTKR